MTCSCIRRQERHRIRGWAMCVRSVCRRSPSGVNVLTWPATMYLSSRNRYWVALLTDANVTMSTGGDTGVFYSTPTSYATGFPATAPAGMTTGPFTRPFTSRFTVSGNCTNVSESLANSDTDYVYSSNSGDEDLYDLDDLVPAAVNVLGVVSKVFFRKSDAGTRTGQLRLKSGATEVGGTDTNPSATYTYTYRVDTTDPNTGAAWSGAAINALQLGVKVTS